MRQILTPVLTLHWMMVFALLAGGLTLGGSGGVGEVFQMMGVEAVGEGLPAAPGGTAPLVFSVGFSLVSALFLWAALDGAFGTERAAHERRDVSMLAFTGAVIMLTAVLGYGFMLPVSGLVRAVMASVAALLFSYLAIAAESWLSRARSKDDRKGHAAIHEMAADAVRKQRLAHIAGRVDDMPSGSGA